MYTTSVSLLQRLRQPGEEEAWNRLVELYTPLLFYWARRVGLGEEDAADLVQEVFTVLIQKLPEFTYDPNQSFRGWLRTITLNKWRDSRRRRIPAPVPADQATLAQLAQPCAAEAFWEAEYRQQLVGRALELMQAEFQPTTWKACWDVVVVGKPVAEVARELNMSLDAVYAAKSRVLRRLRQGLDGLLD
jgi:RNA polymerase sigma-70 factor (ECF subfamily)